MQDSFLQGPLTRDLSGRSVEAVEAAEAGEAVEAYYYYIQYYTHKTAAILLGPECLGMVAVVVWPVLDVLKPAMWFYVQYGRGNVGVDFGFRSRGRSTRYSTALPRNGKTRRRAGGEDSRCLFGRRSLLSPLSLLAEIKRPRIKMIAWKIPMHHLSGRGTLLQKYRVRVPPKVKPCCCMYGGSHLAAPDGS
jgi:hypothetical protein